VTKTCDLHLVGIWYVRTTACNTGYADVFDQVAYINVKTMPSHVHHDYISKLNALLIL
jgi:hypothetical protein